MLLIPGALVLPLLQPFDQQWTVWLHEHGSKEFGLWMGRTMFEGKLPGASDPAIIFLLASLVVYVRSWNVHASQLFRVVAASTMIVFHLLSTLDFLSNRLKKWMFQSLITGDSLGRIFFK